jgi:hypothetical protein
MSSRLIFIGDIHTDAIKRALKNPQLCHKKNVVIEAYRYEKIKDGKPIGDLTENQVDELVSGLSREDMVVSTIGGNLHQTVSLMQHPLAFDFLSNKPDSVARINTDKQLIPYNILYDFFWQGIRSRDGKRLRRLKDHSQSRIFHLVPPPPKKDTDHILKYHETLFAKSGITDRGVSPSELRLKMWRLQLEVLEILTLEYDIELLLPPKESIDSEGFLVHECYANDATHGNKKYGELIIEQLIDLVSQS